MRGGGDLRMADARARRHKVQFARPHQGVHTRRCRGVPPAAEQPADRLQPGVRMRRHVHPAPSHVVWSVVIGETPCPDQRPLPLRQRATHQDGTRAARSGTSARMQHYRRMSMPRRPLRQSSRYRCCSPPLATSADMKRGCNAVAPGARRQFCATRCAHQPEQGSFRNRNRRQRVARRDRPVQFCGAGTPAKRCLIQAIEFASQITMLVTWLSASYCS